jgi:hypothetical protein
MTSSTHQRNDEMKKLNILLRSLCMIAGLCLAFAPSVSAVSVACPDVVDHTIEGASCSGAIHFVESGTFVCRNNNTGGCCKYETVKKFCYADGTYLGYFNQLISTTNGNCINGKCIPTPPPP